MSQEGGGEKPPPNLEQILEATEEPIEIGGTGTAKLGTDQATAISTLKSAASAGREGIPPTSVLNAPVRVGSAVPSAFMTIVTAESASL